MTRGLTLLAIGSVMAGAGIMGPTAWGTSLFRCLDSSEQITYTDSPAQLEQCTPVPTSGAVTSLATTSSASPMPGHPLDAPIPQPILVQPLPPPEGAATVPASPPASAAQNPPPCPIGINPLNPLTNPPCPTNDAIITTPPAMPSAPNTPTSP